MVRQRSIKAIERNVILNEAIIGVKSGKYKSPYAAAKALGVNLTTVLHRMKGGLTRQEARQQQQLLSKTQEETLLKWIKELTISGYAPSHHILREVAEDIRADRCRIFQLPNQLHNQLHQLTQLEQIPNFPLGQDWVPRFIKRHPHLQVRLGRRIEAQRMSGVTKQVVMGWFDAYKDLVTRLHIQEHNVYNMDETGFSIGTMESTRIIVDSTLRTRHQAHQGRQEWVSAVECICMDGTTINPLIIFKGQNVLQSWIPQEVINTWYFSANSKGWTSNLHGVEWLKRVFEPTTRVKADGQQRLLICDGHDSHISGSFISHCMQNRISILILPSHTSHVLQPLDVAIFGPLKKRLTTALSHFNEAQLTRIQKAEWLAAYIKARADTFSTQNITSAWRGAGLKPFQPQRIVREVTLPTTDFTEQQRPQTPQQHDIFETVFQNSSPPDFATLRKANTVLSTTLEARTVLNSPTTRYIRKLADATERLNTRNFLQQRDADNLRLIMQTRKTQHKSKRAILKGQYHISTEELRSQVVQAEEATRQKATAMSSIATHNAIIEQNNEETIEEDSEELYDCIVVEY